MNIKTRGKPTRFFVQRLRHADVVMFTVAISYGLLLFSEPHFTITAEKYQDKRFCNIGHRRALRYQQHDLSGKQSGELLKEKLKEITGDLGLLIM